MIDIMLTKKKFKDFFQKNVAALQQKKFVMTSEGMDFLSNHSLGFQVQMGNVLIPKRCS